MSDDIITLGSSDEEEENVQQRQPTVTVSIGNEKPLNLHNGFDVNQGVLPHQAQQTNGRNGAIVGNQPMQQQQQQQGRVKQPYQRAQVQELLDSVAVQIRQNGPVKRTSQQADLQTATSSRHMNGTADGNVTKRRKLDSSSSMGGGQCSTSGGTSNPNQAKSNSLQKRQNNNNSNQQYNQPGWNAEQAFKRFSETFREVCPTKHAATNITEEDFLGQFECCYQHCGKLVRNNVALMWHLWAHVVQQKPTESEEFSNLQMEEAAKPGATVEEEEKTDVDRLRTCPECLLTQPTPYRIQLHYHRVHKRDGLLMQSTLYTCNICETVIASKQMAEHFRMHLFTGNSSNNKAMALDLPYACRFKNGTKQCRFATSTRLALLEHFSSMHRGSFDLLCPFCLATFHVPALDRKKKRVKANDYVKHVLQHDTEKVRFCAYCVVRFPLSSKQAYDQHTLQHLPSTERKWTKWGSQMSVKDLANLKRTKSAPHQAPDIITKQCIECRPPLKAARDHYSTRPNVCEHCAYSTYCKEAFKCHQLLGHCKPENASRWTFGQKAQRLPPRLHLQCKKCHFESASCQSFAEHAVHCGKAQISVKFVGPPGKAHAELEESRLLGLRAEMGRKSRVEADNKAGRKPKKEEELEQFLVQFFPPARAQNVLQDKNMMTQLKRTEEGQGKEDSVASAFRAMRLSLMPIAKGKLREPPRERKGKGKSKKKG